ncbi:hypothetical protein [Halostreptopolyspora alba]|uniref:Uncharacterized protein n=1 Tax=Halostreptopolyspora alba TaxID=2487137 RepID=A0A3N0DYH1_9ACTN|nr:hypothetical protein EFW17_23130 [Nocardiopsaceae bacterium YIM 96095]
MNTSPKSNDNQTASDRDNARVLEEPTPSDTSAPQDEPEDSAREDDHASDQGGPEWESEVVPTGTSRTAGILTAETFAITSLLALSAVLVGTRITQNLPSVLGQSQEGIFSGMLAGEGALSLLAVILAVVSLLLANHSTQPWSRWVATAVIIIGVIVVAVSVATYMLVPEPQPQPMMPTG